MPKPISRVAREAICGARPADVTAAVTAASTAEAWSCSAGT